MPNRHERLRRRAHRLISRWGFTEENGAVMALLRDPSGENRACVVLEDSFSPNLVRSGLVQQGDRRFLMSNLVPTDSGEPTVLVPPTEEDVLVVQDPDEDSEVMEMNIVAPPGRLAPSSTVIYYELHCRPT